MATSLVQDLFLEAKEQFIVGNYKVAEPMLQQMILQNSRNPEVFQMLATIYYDKGQFNKAIKTFKRALEIDPTYTDASVGLSIILNDIGKYEEGRKIFSEAQAILDRKKSEMDSYVQEKISAKHEEIADLYFQYKHFNEAIEQLNLAYKLTTRKTEINMRIIECQIQSGQKDKAIKDLQKLIRENPQFLQARIKLGVIFYNQNRIVEAIEQWEAVLFRDPTHPEATRYLELAQKSQGDALSL
jgi:tetratricopeptide (TPR) repeat protein